MKIQADVVIELDTKALQYMEPRGDLGPIQSALQVILGEDVQIKTIHHFSVLATENQHETEWWSNWLRAHYTEYGIMPFDGDKQWAIPPKQPTE